MTNFTFNEIHQQPAMWRKEYEALLNAKAQVSAFMHKYLTPETDIVLTGAGTSAFIGDALQPVMRGMWRNVRSVPTTDIITHAEYLLDKERPLLLISFARWAKYRTRKGISRPIGYIANPIGIYIAAVYFLKKYTA